MKFHKPRGLITQESFGGIRAETWHGVGGRARTHRNKGLIYFIFSLRRSWGPLQLLRRELGLSLIAGDPRPSLQDAGGWDLEQSTTRGSRRSEGVRGGSTPSENVQLLLNGGWKGFESESESQEWGGGLRQRFPLVPAGGNAGCLPRPMCHMCQP